jgi:predicted RNA-binding Zn-ribbon protein involved in translation (DUF1610 family)
MKQATEGIDMSQSGEVFTDCPDCGVEIPFYETVDELGKCPNCGTSKDRLFEIAIGSKPIEPAEDDPGTVLAMTDGGQND